MPPRIDPRHLTTKAHLGETGLRLLRPLDPGAATIDLQALEAQATATAALLDLADAERFGVVSDALRALKLAPLPDLPLTQRLSSPGTTVQLGLDYPGHDIDAHGAAHVHRSSSGRGSFITLSAPEQSARFRLDLASSGEGVYLAVVHVGPIATRLDARIWVYPGGILGDTATRSNSKFLFPFEITAYAHYATIALSLPAGTTDDLAIARVDVTKVS